MPKTGCWRLAQTPDHRTYYYHSGKKLTKWVLDPDERNELMTDLKSFFVNKDGWMWKRAPRISDKDKGKMNLLQVGQLARRSIYRRFASLRPR